MPSVSQIPRCTNKMKDEDPPCGTPMFRIGTVTNFAFVCPTCDKNYLPEKGLDAGSASS